MEKNNQVLYKVGTKNGILKDLFARNRIQLCKTQFFTLKEVKGDVIAFRTVIRVQSKFGGQGFVKCYCRKKCLNKSKCKKNNVLCNSKCSVSRT